MARSSTLFLLLTLVNLLPFVTMPAYADSVPVASYAIYGTLSVTGNNSCGGPCVETITYSFTLDYFQVTLASFRFAPMEPCLVDLVSGLTSTCYQAASVGPVLVSASGPLGIFGDKGYGCCWFDGGYYIPFVNAQNDEIDLFLGPGTTYPASGIPTPYAVDSHLYICGSGTCGVDFGNNVFGTAEFTATPLGVPEPSTLALLATGMLAIGLFVAASRKVSSVESAP